MAEFLSQDEIDALLDIAEQGEDIETPIERVISKEKITLFMISKNQIEYHPNN